MNLGGASDRPFLSQVWENVKAKLDEKPVVHQRYAFTGILDRITEALGGSHKQAPA